LARFDHFVDEGSFTVVNVGNNGNISDFHMDNCMGKEN
jgi:hypothetical protein